MSFKFLFPSWTKNYLKYKDVTNEYIIPAMNIIGLFTNLISLTIFIIINKENRTNNKIFYYCLLKTVCDFIYNLIYSLFEFINVRDLEGEIRTAKLFFIFINFYLKYVLCFASAAFEIMATFDCAISINQKIKWIQTKLSFISITISIVLFSFLIEIFNLISNKIKRNEYIDILNTTHIRYVISDHIYGKDSLLYKLELIENTLRDVVSMNILFILNIYILVKLVEIRKRKNNLKAQNKQSSFRSISNSAECRKMKMIITFFILQIIGHYPYFLTELSRKQTLFSLKATNYLKTTSDILYQLPIMTPFFIYFFFNNQFRNVFVTKLRLLGVGLLNFNSN
jgi:hypothetical protein